MASLRPGPSADRTTGGRRPPRNLAARRRSLPVLVVVALLSAACVGEPPEVVSDDPDLVTGRAIYASSCASCHGSDGGGGVGTRLNNGAMVAAYPDIQDQIDLVTNGKNRMPAFVGRLDEDQVRAVVRYTREVL